MLQATEARDHAVEGARSVVSADHKGLRIADHDRTRAGQRADGLAVDHGQGCARIHGDPRQIVDRLSARQAQFACVQRPVAGVAVRPAESPGPRAVQGARLEAAGQGGVQGPVARSRQHQAVNAVAADQHAGQAGAADQSDVIRPSAADVAAIQAPGQGQGIGARAGRCIDQAVHRRTRLQVQGVARARQDNRRAGAIPGNHAARLVGDGARPARQEHAPAVGQGALDQAAVGDAGARAAHVDAADHCRRRRAGHPDRAGVGQAGVGAVGIDARIAAVHHAGIADDGTRAPGIDGVEGPAGHDAAGQVDDGGSAAGAEEGVAATGDHTTVGQRAAGIQIDSLAGRSADRSRVSDRRPGGQRQHALGDAVDRACVVQDASGSACAQFNSAPAIDQTARIVGHRAVGGEGIHTALEVAEAATDLARVDHRQRAVGGAVDAVVETRNDPAGQIGDRAGAAEEAHALRAETADRPGVGYRTCAVEGRAAPAVDQAARLVVDRRARRHGEDAVFELVEAAVNGAAVDERTARIELNTLDGAGDRARDYQAAAVRHHNTVGVGQGP